MIGSQCPELPDAAKLGKISENLILRRSGGPNKKDHISLQAQHANSSLEQEAEPGGGGTGTDRDERRGGTHTCVLRSRAGAPSRQDQLKTGGPQRTCAVHLASRAHRHLSKDTCSQHVHISLKGLFFQFLQEDRTKPLTLFKGRVGRKSISSTKPLK